MSARVLGRPSVIRIDAHNARVRRWFRRRRFLRWWSRRVCRMDRRLHSLVKLMRQYVSTCLLVFGSEVV